MLEHSQRLNASPSLLMIENISIVPKQKKPPHCIGGFAGPRGRAAHHACAKTTWPCEPWPSGLPDGSTTVCTCTTLAGVLAYNVTASFGAPASVTTMNVAPTWTAVRRSFETGACLSSSPRNA